MTEEASAFLPPLYPHPRPTSSSSAASFSAASPPATTTATPPAATTTSTATAATTTTTTTTATIGTPPTNTTLPKPTSTASPASVAAGTNQVHVTTSFDDDGTDVDVDAIMDAPPLDWMDARWEVRQILKSYLRGRYYMDDEEEEEEADELSPGFDDEAERQEGDREPSRHQPRPTQPSPSHDVTTLTEDSSSFLFSRRRRQQLLRRLRSHGTTAAGQDRTVNDTEETSIITFALDHNLDVYLGSVVFSTALLVLSILSLANDIQQQDQENSASMAGAPSGNLTTTMDDDDMMRLNVSTTTAIPLTFPSQADSSVHRAQFVASVIFAGASVLSWWILRRTANVQTNDTERSKKRQIRKFLQATRGLWQELQQQHQKQQRHLAALLAAASVDPNSPTSSSVREGPTTAPWEELPLPPLQGTSLTDLYPVYRKFSSSYTPPPLEKVVGEDATPSVRTSPSTVRSGNPIRRPSNISSSDDEDNIHATAPPATAAEPKPANHYSWARLPSLLMVRGDYIALQIGDVCPADCVLLNNKSLQNVTTHPSTTRTSTPTTTTATAATTNASSSLVIHAGERLTVERFGAVAQHASDALPKGRVTIPTSASWRKSENSTSPLSNNRNPSHSSSTTPVFRHSSPNVATSGAGVHTPMPTNTAAGDRHLLTLCNQTHVFRVLRAPLQEFIYRVPPPKKHSQVRRKLENLRRLLLALVPIFVILTALAILVRPQTTSRSEKGNDDLDLLALSLPILAALAISPSLVGPIMVFQLEAVGTARILQSVHPHAMLLLESKEDHLRLLETVREDHPGQHLSSPAPSFTSPQSSSTVASQPTATPGPHVNPLAASIAAAVSSTSAAVAQTTSAVVSTTTTGIAAVVQTTATGVAAVVTTTTTGIAAVVPDPTKKFIADTKLLIRYIWATVLTRLSLWVIWDALRCVVGQVKSSVTEAIAAGASTADIGGDQRPSSSRLVRVPPASMGLLEKLGVCTAFCLVDDELACEPSSIPQQLLIPTANGLKLLDLCPNYDDDEDNGDDGGANTVASGSTNATPHWNRHPPPKHKKQKRNPTNAQSFEFDSDEEEEKNDDDDSDEENALQMFLRQKILKARFIRRRRRRRQPFSVRSSLELTPESEIDNPEDSDSDEDSQFDVQFEDPTWWQYLPSLKGIGLACLLVEEFKVRPDLSEISTRTLANQSRTSVLDHARETLLKLVTAERKSHHLRALAECIGFSTDPNIHGARGDLSYFNEVLRMNIISKSLSRERLLSDVHELSSTQAKWWGLLRADSTSVICRDSRSNGYQLLTVGDPELVTNLCNEAWQGEISTIFPLAQADRQTILQTANSWKLSDLDVAAFSYAPVPKTLEDSLMQKDQSSTVYLLDNPAPNSQAIFKDKTVSKDWGWIKNQVFLGVLGSLVVPRREIQKVLSVLSDAGVRFVYFSPRNMRRQKELASQMGIDVAWNCAISLRPLESGENFDQHRMVSSYADWDVNAKLPHGVEEVRRHLEEVDNVPLLVSLYTDTTKDKTKEIVEIFQEYHDTVIAIGIAHLPRNDGIFRTADIAVGIDVLGDQAQSTHSISKDKKKNGGYQHQAFKRMFESEMELASAIASHDCAFRFRGISSLTHIPSMIEQGRAALEAATNAGIYFVQSLVALAMFVLFSACTPATTVAHVPSIGVVCFLFGVLPTVGFCLALTGPHGEIMKKVPPKNDVKVTYGRKEGYTLYMVIVLRALPIALIPQLLYLIAFGELMITLEPDLMAFYCPGKDSAWYKAIRCNALRSYAGPARISAGIVVFCIFVITATWTAMNYIHRWEPARLSDLWNWRRSRYHYYEPKKSTRDWWVPATLVACTFASLVVTAGSAERGTRQALPWYFYLSSVLYLGFCLVWNEYVKTFEAKRETRAEKLRRLQFETRLGAWSPK